MLDKVSDIGIICTIIKSYMSIKNKQTDNNAKIATETKNIAHKTHQIAQDIVEESNSKEFNGKEQI